MGKIIEFKPREAKTKAAESNIEFPVEIERLEWWILNAKVYAEKIANGNYTRLDMLDLMCSLAGIHNALTSTETTLEVFSSRKKEAEKAVR